MKNRAMDFYKSAMALANQPRTEVRYSQEVVAMAQEAMYGGSLDADDQKKLIRLMVNSGDIGPLNDIVTTEVQQRYKQARSAFMPIMLRRPNVLNLKDVAHIKITGADQRLKAVLELEEYGQISPRQDPEKKYHCGKYGHLVQLSWEMLVNDGPGVLKKLPEMLYDGAHKTLEGFLCSLFFTSSGPSTAFFTQQPGGAPATLPLTVDNLKTAIGEMYSYLGPDDDPIDVSPKFLIVPPALKIQAMQILNSINLAFPVDGSGSGDGVPIPTGTTNPLAALNLQLLVSPWISKIVTSGTKGKTSWMLASSPSEIPIGEIGFLEGFETPEILTPMEVGATAQSIISDVFTWRVKHVYGGCTLDPRAGWASTGQ